MVNEGRAGMRWRRTRSGIWVASANVIFCVVLIKGIRTSRCRGEFIWEDNLRRKRR